MYRRTWVNGDELQSNPAKWKVRRRKIEALNFLFQMITSRDKRGYALLGWQLFVAATAGLGITSRIRHHPRAACLFATPGSTRHVFTYHFCTWATFVPFSLFSIQIALRQLSLKPPSSWTRAEYKRYLRHLPGLKLFWESEGPRLAM